MIADYVISETDTMLHRHRLCWESLQLSVSPHVAPQVTEIYCKPIHYIASLIEF